MECGCESPPFLFPLTLLRVLVVGDAKWEVLRNVEIAAHPPLCRSLTQEALTCPPHDDRTAPSRGFEVVLLDKHAVRQ